MSFWAWAEMWDLGFAMVMVMERSIWAMLGNSTNREEQFDWVYSVPSASGADARVVIGVPAADCGAGANGDTGCIPTVEHTGSASYSSVAWIWDAGMMLGGNLDVDLNNAYYVYIMSALYFAVPAVTGQAVLGAKAGAAGMITGAWQQMSSDGGRGASSGFTGSMAAQIGQAGQQASQSSYEAGMRGGFGQAAIANSANQAQSQTVAAAAQGQSTAIGGAMSANGNARDLAMASNQGQFGVAAATVQGAQGFGSTRPGADGAAAKASGLSNGLNAGNTAISIGNVRDQSQISGTAASNNARNGALQHDANMTASAQNARAGVQGTSSQRMSDAANYDSGNRQADLMRNTQLASAGKFAAAGQFAGGQYQYQRPQNMMGAAMMGMLGNEASNNAWSGVTGDAAARARAGNPSLQGGLTASAGANERTINQAFAGQHMNPNNFATRNADGSGVAAYTGGNYRSDSGIGADGKVSAISSRAADHHGTYGVQGGTFGGSHAHRPNGGRDLALGGDGQMGVMGPADIGGMVKSAVTGPNTSGAGDGSSLVPPPPAEPKPGP
jgi:hypothetical protein